MHISVHFRSVFCLKNWQCFLSTILWIFKVHSNIRKLLLKLFNSWIVKTPILLKLNMTLDLKKSLIFWLMSKTCPTHTRGLFSYFQKCSQPKESHYSCFPNQNFQLSSENISFPTIQSFFPFSIIFQYYIELPQFYFNSRIYFLPLMPSFVFVTVLLSVLGI